MSLIDPKHLAAPFQNTTHIVTIVFLVVLFAVFRLATGSVEIRTGTVSNTGTSRLGTLPEAPQKPILPDASKNQNDSEAQGLNDIEKALGIKQ
jgi:hypothetical protein